MSKLLTLEWLRTNGAARWVEEEFQQLCPKGEAPLHEVVEVLAACPWGVRWWLFEWLLNYCPALQPHRAKFEVTMSAAKSVYYTAETAALAYTTGAPYARRALLAAEAAFGMARSDAMRTVAKQLEVVL